MSYILTFFAGATIGGLIMAIVVVGDKDDD